MSKSFQDNHFDSLSEVISTLPRYRLLNRSVVPLTLIYSICSHSLSFMPTYLSVVWLPTSQLQTPKFNTDLSNTNTYLSFLSSNIALLDLSNHKSSSRSRTLPHPSQPVSTRRPQTPYFARVSLANPQCPQPPNSSSTPEPSLCTNMHSASLPLSLQPPCCTREYVCNGVTLFNVS